MHQESLMLIILGAGVHISCEAWIENCVYANMTCSPSEGVGATVNKLYVHDLCLAGSDWGQNIRRILGRAVGAVQVRVLYGHLRP